MSVREEFEKEFFEEEFEILALLREDCGGASVIGDMLKPSVFTLAIVDLRTNQLSEEKGRLEWLIPNNKDRKGWGYDFKQFEIYHCRVRKCIPRELLEYQSKDLNNCYMLLEVMENNITNPALVELQTYYRTPVVMENEFGTFTLDRRFSHFAGTVDLLGEKVKVFLDMDEDSKDTANVALETFLKITEDFEGNDKRFREFAAEQLTELANDWLVDSDEENPEEISEETFASRISMSELCCENDGWVTMYYYDDDMFWGHAIEIVVDEEGELERADIVG